MFISTTLLAKDWGYWIQSPDSSKKLRIGGRLQGAMSLTDEEDSTQDFYIRRMRLNLEYYPMENQKIYLDIRSDKTNYKDKGELPFLIGDAYWEYKTSKTTNIRVYRGKADVSYSQTTSSRNLLFIERAAIAEHAAGFITESRRGANVQANGTIDNRFTYQLIFGDGVQSDDLEDLGGNGVTSIIAQNFFYGAKLRYYFFHNQKDFKPSDTTYGKGQTLAIGAGYFIQNKLKIAYNASDEEVLNRTLLNVDLKFSKGRFNLLTEYFRFTNDLIDLPSSTFGASSGFTHQLEVMITNDLKHAIYFKNEDFNRYEDSASDSHYQASGIGYNHYIDEVALRWGVFLEDIKENQNIGQDAMKKFTLYTMMNY